MRRWTSWPLVSWMGSASSPCRRYSMSRIFGRGSIRHLEKRLGSDRPAASVRRSGNGDGINSAGPFPPIGDPGPPGSWSRPAGPAGPAGPHAVPCAAEPARPSGPIAHPAGPRTRPDRRSDVARDRRFGPARSARRWDRAERVGEGRVTAPEIRDPTAICDRPRPGTRRSGPEAAGDPARPAPVRPARPPGQGRSQSLLIRGIFIWHQTGALQHRRAIRVRSAFGSYQDR